MSYAIHLTQIDANSLEIEMLFPSIFSGHKSSYLFSIKCVGNLCLVLPFYRASHVHRNFTAAVGIHRDIHKHSGASHFMLSF
jgi:hypothetical protein